jgi:hypothetical protein
MFSYSHLLPGILAEVAVAFFFFGLLLASGVATFGGSLGTPGRAAVVPLLVIPLVEDLVRYCSNCSFKTAWLAAVLFWVACVVVKLALRPVSSRRWPRLLFARRWQIAFGFALLFHVVLRLWIFTGTEPNPRDDLWGGFKANALFNSSGWPTPNPEIPELSFPYYYFVYMWPAGIAAWSGMSVWALWWPTIIVFSTLGTLLIIELWLPFIRSKRAMVAAVIAATVGASVVLPLDLIFKLQPKTWVEWGFLPPFFVPANLYLQLPTQMQAIEAPFDVFCNGLLLTVVWLIIRGWRRALSWNRYFYITLAVAALAGYCTFHLMGYVVVVLPALFLLALRDGLVLAWRRLAPIALSGMVSLVLAWPLLSEQLHRRGHSALVPGFEPLYLWVPRHPAFFGLIGLAFGMVFLLVLLNPLGIWAAFTRAARSPWTRLLQWMFLWGCLTCLWGSDGYVLKMGTFISLAGVCLFVLQFDRRSRFELWLGALCLFGPVLLLLNNIRANATVEKIDPVWVALDRAALGSSLPVFFPSGKEERLVPYFSRARFMGTTGEIDNQYADYLSDLDALAKLPDWPERLRRLNPGATSYLYLRKAGVELTSKGRVIYQDPLYTLTLEPMP